MWRGDGRVARCLAIAALESCRCTEGGGGAPTGVVPGPVTATRNVQEKTMQSYVAEYASATRSSRLEGQGLLVVPCWKGKGCWSSQPGRAWLQPVTLGASPQVFQGNTVFLRTDNWLRPAANIQAVRCNAHLC